jgi:hypothetical protein
MVRPASVVGRGFGLPIIADAVKEAHRATG